MYEKKGTAGINPGYSRTRLVLSQIGSGTSPTYCNICGSNNLTIIAREMMQNYFECDILIDVCLLCGSLASYRLVEEERYIERNTAENFYRIT